jgi:predicted nucleic acid-binding protein
VPEYLDTSAFLKLVRSEPESRALRREIAGVDLIASALLVVEGRRAALRYGTLALRRARVALTAITLLPIDDEILDAAAGMEPPELRSLDAVHLATALSLGGELERMFCYDTRLTDAAIAVGLEVLQPA